MAELFLLSKDLLKLHLELGDETDEDDQLQRICFGVESAINSQSKRRAVPGESPFKSLEATEHYSGHGRQWLYLKRRPVTSIARVSIDSDAYFGKGDSPWPAEDDVDEGDDFVSASYDEDESNPGALIRIGLVGFDEPQAIWQRGIGNILVKYTAGYARPPHDLQMAALQMAAVIRTSVCVGAGGPVSSQRLGDASWKLLNDPRAAGQQGATIRSLIAPYVEP